METTGTTSLRYIADKGYKDALKNRVSYLHITEREIILTDESDDINNPRESYDIKSVSGYEKGKMHNLSLFVEGKEIVYRVYKKDEIIAAIELRRRDIFNQDCEELPKLTDGDISINKKTFDYNMIDTQELGQDKRSNFLGKVVKVQNKLSEITLVVLVILLIIFLVLVLNLSSCSNQKFEKRALSFVQSNGIETYVVFHSQKNHLVYYKNAGDSLGVYDLKSQKHKSIGSTYSLGIKKAFPSVTLFDEEKIAINNVKSLYLTSSERNGVVLVSEPGHDGDIPEEIVTLILPDEEVFRELCRGNDIRIYSDNIIECYNYENRLSDFEYVLISKGEKVSYPHRYCGYLDNKASSFVNGSLIEVDSLLIGSFYTDDPYDRVPVCGAKKYDGDIILKSIDGHSEITLESYFSLSHIKASVIGSSKLPERMELFDIKQTGDWRIENYTDIMGNTLPEFYIWKSISLNEKNIGRFIIDKEGINIELFDSSYSTAPIHSHGIVNWIVQFGSRYDQFRFKSYNDRDGGNRVLNGYFNDLLYILSMGNNLKFHADDTDLADLLFNLSGDKYDFEINTAYFTNAWFDMFHRQDYF